MRFGGYLVLATFVAAVTYPVFGHWAWGDANIAEGIAGSDGWLKQLGFVDFAGSTVVQTVGGWVALAAIIVIGPRIGRFGAGALPYSAVMTCRSRRSGCSSSGVGWYGFTVAAPTGSRTRCPR